MKQESGCGNEFPFFGARYPDARCVDGQLYDLDNCDEHGRLYKPGEYVPCPVCRKDEFKKSFDMSEDDYQEYLKTIEKYLTDNIDS